MRAAFHTFGCKLNQFETEALASAFRSQGFSLVEPSQPADLYLVNTCTVTGRSEQKARVYIRRLCREHPQALVVVTGCYAQLEAEALRELGPNLLVVSQEDKSRLLELPGRLLAGGIAAAALPEPAEGRPDPFGFQVERFSFHSRAFLKIQDGCDHRCAYCRVPLARGESRSLDPGAAADRLRELESRGYREVVLTGVNISSYCSGGRGLAALLEELVAATREVRLRLSSLEPEAVEPELARVLGGPRIRPHFHLTVQSGSDRMLRAMRRRYSAAGALRAVELLRGAQDRPFLAADLIAGFPGEREEDFQATRSLAEQVVFAKLHVFPFSPRPGTEAAEMKDRVPERIRDQRTRALRALSEELAGRYRRSWLQRELEVVLEKRLRDGSWQGLSGNYLKVIVRGLPVEGARPIVPGGLVRLRLEEAGEPCEGAFLSFV